MIRTRSPYIPILAACFGVFIAADDQVVVVTILPSIMGDFRLGVDDLSQVSWIITAYLLGYTCGMPLIGKLSDVYGHRTVYVSAMLLFAVGSVLCAIANDLWPLVAFRVIQAVGGGAVIPVTIAMIGHLFPPGRRAPALGILGASAEFGGVIGPMWGALLDRFLDWRWVFWINVPLVAASILLLLLLVPGGTGQKTPVDYLGGFWIMLSLVLFTLSISRWPDYPPLAAAGIVLSLALAAGFIWRERRIPYPLIPPALFRRATFSGANLTHFFVGIGLIIAMVNVPLITNTVMGKEPLEGGLRLVRFTAAIPVGGILGGLAVSRLGYRLPTALGLALAAVSFFLMMGWDTSLTDPALTIHLVIGGFGFGLVIAPIAAAAVDSSPAAHRGSASGLLTVMRLMGMTVGLAAIAAWGTDRFDILVRDIDLPFTDPDYVSRVSEAGLSVFEGFFLVAFVVSLVALVPTFFMKRVSADVELAESPPRREEDGPGPPTPAHRPQKDDRFARKQP